MKRVLPSFLLAVYLLVSLSFAGMAFFGMEATMRMDMTCMGAGCDPMDHGASSEDCVSHCIAAVSPSSTLFMPIAMALLVLAFFLRADAEVALGSRFAPIVQRWREGIGKALRHQSLSTIVLRN